MSHQRIASESTELMSLAWRAFGPVLLICCRLDEWAARTCTGAVETKINFINTISLFFCHHIPSFFFLNIDFSNQNDKICVNLEDKIPLKSVFSQVKLVKNSSRVPSITQRLLKKRVVAYENKKERYLRLSGAREVNLNQRLENGGLKPTFLFWPEQCWHRWVEFDKLVPGKEVSRKICPFFLHQLLLMRWIRATLGVFLKRIHKVDLRHWSVAWLTWFRNFGTYFLFSISFCLQIES